MTLRQTINKIKKLFSNDNVFLKINYHYLSGFILLDNGQYIYVSSNDERINPKWENNMLFRTAKDNKDYSGGMNYFFDINEISREDILKRLGNGK